MIQLFRVVRDVAIPLFAATSVHDNRSSIKTRTLATMAFFWPDGSPCIPVEMFLLEKAQQMTVRELDGGSLKPLASQLSHLVRFCFNSCINFWELDDSTFLDFVTNYLQEPSNNPDGFKRRASNTNRSAVKSSIDFLKWLQDNLHVDRVIVGPASESPQIRLVRKRIVTRTGKTAYQWVFPYEPHISTRDPKGPISNSLRNRLWDVTRTVPKIHQSPVVNDYLAARRELMLTLLEATGSRPSEITEMDLRENSSVSLNNKLCLSTKKRRRLGKDPKRNVPCAFEVAIVLEQFVDVQRRALVDWLTTLGFNPDPNALFLSARDGTPLRSTAMEKEFQRMVARAQISQRACMSMFRHRFITIQVALHLRDHLDQRPRLKRDAMILVDKITILTRVAQLTGHAEPESLLHYIDLAWDYLDVFRPIDQARALERRIAGTLPFLRHLCSSVENSRLTKKELVMKVTQELENLEKRIRDDLLCIGANTAKNPEERRQGD